MDRHKSKTPPALPLAEVATLLVTLLRHCSQVLIPSAARLPTLALLDALTRIAVAMFSKPLLHSYPPEFWRLLTEMDTDPGEETAYRGSWWFPIRYLELALRAPGALTRTAVSHFPEDEVFELHSSDDVSVIPFSRMLRTLRTGLKQTQISFSSGFGAWGCKQVAISSWERGTTIPSRAQGILIYYIARKTDCQKLYSAWVAARQNLEHVHPRAQARDVDFGAFLLPFSQTVEWLTGEDSFAANTSAARRADLAWVMASAGLPTQNPVRSRGLGWHAAAVTPLHVLNPEVIDSFLSLAAARSNSRSDHTLCRQLTCGRLARMTGPGGGFRVHAAKLATLAEDVDLTWLATVWPSGSDLEGRPCKSLRDRIVAQSYLAHRRYRKLAQQCVGLSKRQHSSLEQLRRRFEYPLVGVWLLLLRLPLVPHLEQLVTDDERDAAMVASFLVANIFRPLSDNDHEYHHWELKRHSQCFCLLIWEPAAAGATPRLRRTVMLPPFLNPFFEPWHLLRSALGPTTLPYYLRSSGAPHNNRSFAYTLRRITKQWAQDIFPRGLAPHNMMTVVATEILKRVGRIEGIPLAAMVCRQPAQAIGTRHLLRIPRGQVSAGPDCKELEACVGAAFADACALSKISNHAPTTRLRRTTDEIRRTTRRKKR